MNEVVETALQAMLLGIFMALVYDVLRFVRFLIKKSPTWLVSVFDIAWFLLYAVCIFIFIMTTGEGMLRLYHFGFAFLGTSCYLLSIGRFTNFIFMKIAKLLHFILSLIFKPLKKFYLFFKQKIGFVFVHIYRFFIKMFKNQKKYLLKRVKILYNYLISRKPKSNDINLQNLKGSVRKDGVLQKGSDKPPIKATVKATINANITRKIWFFLSFCCKNSHFSQLMCTCIHFSSWPIGNKCSEYKKWFSSNTARICQRTERSAWLLYQRGKSKRIHWANCPWQVGLGPPWCERVL